MPAARAALPSVDLLGMRIHALSEPQVIEHILAELSAGRGGWLATPNLDHLRRLVSDPEFRSTCSRAALLVPDGIPLLWAGRLQGTPLPGRVAGSDLISSLTAAAAAAGRSVFLLGGNPGTETGAARCLLDRHPGLRVAGTACPASGFERDEAAMNQLVETLTAARPDIVYVALGSPKQEVLMDRLAPTLPQTWWLGVGISFSFLHGEIRRAPRWMQKSGLEWLYRLIQEPRRLAGRYLRHGIPFAGRLLLSSAMRGLRRRCSTNGR